MDPVQASEVLGVCFILIIITGIPAILVSDEIWDKKQELTLVVAIILGIVLIGTGLCFLS